MACASNSVRRPLALPGAAGSVMPRNSSGARFSRPAAFTAPERRQRLHQRLRRAARLGDHDEARVGQREGAERRLQRDGIEVVVEAHARALALGLAGHAGDVPAAELRQRLAAQARAADAEEDDGVGAPREPGQRRLGRDEVRGLLGDAQVRQPSRAVVLLQRRDGGPERIEPARQLGRRSAHAGRWRRRGSRQSNAYRKPRPSARSLSCSGSEP